MKRISTITALFIVLLHLETSLAAQSINNQIVSYVSTGWGAEGIYVRTVVSNTSVDGCGPKFRIEPNHPLLKEMVSMLLSAFHAGSKVNLYVDGCINTNLMNLKSVALTK